MNPSQFRHLIVRPALEAIDLWSEDAEALVVGTAAVESHLEYVKQVGGGPALGFFQMEPATYADIWDHYLAYRPNLVQTVLEAIGATTRPPADRLVWDARLGAIMCRLHYRRDPKRLPHAHDVWAQAEAWKRHYNTHLGAGTPQKYVDAQRVLA